jgi:2,3-bisphosphoglycerate-dependent phosphoglycerate mutase
MNILIAAHGNSLRSLIKYLEVISDEDIVKLEIPTGAPIHYSFDEDGNVITKKNLIE